MRFPLQLVFINEEKMNYDELYVPTYGSNKYLLELK